MSSDRSSRIPSTIFPTPDALVEQGRIYSGFFKEPFRHVNLLDAPNMGGAPARPLRWLRLKEWVGFGVNHEELFGGIIIQDAKVAASATVYLYDKKRREQHEWLILDLPGHLKLPETLWNSDCHCGSSRRYLHFSHRLDWNHHRIQAAVPATSKKPALHIDITGFQNIDKVDPLVVSLPILPDHHTYTHKSPLHFEGVIRIGEREYRFDPQRDKGNLDEQKTWYPYRSQWRWGCFICTTKAGREVMTNFVNQMTPKDQPGEDAIWVDGRLCLLEQPDILPESTKGAFRLEDKAGRVKLRFNAEGSKAEKRNYGLISMDYDQFYGFFNGEVTDDGGETHVIENAFGALECMNARF